MAAGAQDAQSAMEAGVSAQSSCEAPISLLLCLQSKLHALDVLAMALRHGGAMGGWSNQPGNPCLLLLDKQR